MLVQPEHRPPVLSGSEGEVDDISLYPQVAHLE